MGNCYSLDIGFNYFDKLHNDRLKYVNSVTPQIEFIFIRVEIKGQIVGENSDLLLFVCSTENGLNSVERRSNPAFGVILY